MLASRWPPSARGGRPRRRSSVGCEEHWRCRRRAEVTRRRCAAAPATVTGRFARAQPGRVIRPYHWRACQSSTGGAPRRRADPERTWQPKPTRPRLPSHPPPGRARGPRDDRGWGGRCAALPARSCSCYSSGRSSRSRGTWLCLRSRAPTVIEAHLGNARRRRNLRRPADSSFRPHSEPTSPRTP